MSRAEGSSIRLLVLCLCLAGAGAAGFLAGRSDWQMPVWLAFRPQPQISLAAAANILYYRDPDGLPAYSLAPVKTSAGKAYVAVREGEDTSFTDQPAITASDPIIASATASEPKRIRFYRNPMGLPDKSDTPKKDSMGMDYLPVYEGEENDDGNVKLSPGKIQKSGVRSERVERMSLKMPLHAPGIIQLDERRISVVSLRFEGFIESVENITTGSRVKKGQPLMRVYGSALSNAAAEYLSALNARNDGAPIGQTMKGARRRLENLGMHDTAIITLEKTREVPASIIWSSPQDGIILERAATPGMRAAAGDVMFRIADASMVWAMIDLNERDMANVTLGQTVTLNPRGMPGKTFSGKNSLLYPQINRETRTVRVRVELNNPDGLLMPDMYVEADIATGSGTEVLTVPDSAVIDSGERQLVLIDKGDGRFEPRAVKLGRYGNGRVEVREGVMESEKVVTSANFLIDAESNLKAALEGFNTQEVKQ